MQGREGYALDLESSKPEKLDSYGTESTILMELHVPLDYFSGGAMDNFKGFCKNTKLGYSFEAKPAASAPPVGIVSKQHSS
jgi:hypothetical protein